MFSFESRAWNSCVNCKLVGLVSYFYIMFSALPWNINFLKNTSLIVEADKLLRKANERGIAISTGGLGNERGTKDSQVTQNYF